MVKDLTVGKPAGVLLKLSLPMFVSVLFQQFYNMADSIIAGQFVGENALAAIGASYPITMIFMAVALGLNIGCSVIISQLFGAKELEKTKTAIFTSLIAIFAISAVLTVIGVFICDKMMSWINTPGDIMADGALYLKIYIGGLVFLFLYNASTAVFTALGDTRTPLIFLILSSLLNILLDYLFVAVVHWGVGGIAWATFISQGLACVLSVTVLLFNLKKIKSGKFKIFSFSMVGRLAKYALPSILQQSCVSIGNILVQSVVNRYGSSVIAGFSAATKLNVFTMTCLMNMANGMSTFTAQNVGAGKIDRIKKAFRIDLGYMLAICLPFILLYCIGGEYMMKLFVINISPEALDAGLMMIKIVSPFYVIACIKILCDSVLRGTGAMIFFLISTASDLILRVVLSFVWSPSIGMNAVYWAWPIGWGVGTALALIFYTSGVWKKGIKPGKTAELYVRENIETVLMPAIGAASDFNNSVSAVVSAVADASNAPVDLENSFDKPDKGATLLDNTNKSSILLNNNIEKTEDKSE